MKVFYTLSISARICRSPVVFCGYPYYLKKHRLPRASHCPKRWEYGDERNRPWPAQEKKNLDLNFWPLVANVISVAEGDEGGNLPRKYEFCAL